MGIVKPGKFMVFIVCLALAIAFGVTGTSAQEAMKISGKLTLTYTQQDSIIVGDKAGHLMTLDASEGKNVSTGGNAFMDGAKITNLSQADVTNGSGANQGYVIFTMGDDVTYGKWEGIVTMVMSAEGQPDVSFEGTFTFIKGMGQFKNVKGGGTYKGKFTSDTEYFCEWQGEYTIAK